MKTYDLTDDEGHVFGFEVSNAVLPRSTACRVAQRIPGTKLIRGPRIFPNKAEFCEFELDGVTFVLWEPWGDNSRYWIGPKTGQWVPQLGRVREEFIKWQPFGFLRRGVACLRRVIHASHAA